MAYRNYLLILGLLPPSSVLDVTLPSGAMTGPRLQACLWNMMLSHDDARQCSATQREVTSLNTWRYWAAWDTLSTDVWLHVWFLVFVLTFARVPCNLYCVESKERLAEVAYYVTDYSIGSLVDFCLTLIFFLLVMTFVFVLNGIFSSLKEKKLWTLLAEGMRSHM